MGDVLWVESSFCCLVGEWRDIIKTEWKIFSTCCFYKWFGWTVCCIVYILSMYFESALVLFILLASINQAFWGFTDKNSWKSQWVWLFRMMMFWLLMSWWIFIIENFLLREWGCGIYSGLVVMEGWHLEGWQWWTEAGKEGFWRGGERVDALLTERNVMAKWKQNMTRGQNPNTRFFSILKQCSE